MGKDKKPELHISKDDFIDITTTPIATPAVRKEIEQQVEASEQFKIVIDEQ